MSSLLVFKKVYRLEIQSVKLVFSRVVDPYSFFTDPDPDPEFDVGDQYGSGSKYGSGSGSKSNTDPGLK
jgi:hypothetical protein